MNARRDGLPPHNVAAEEAVIAALLLDGEAWRRAASIVRPDDFFRDQNGWIYTACLSVAERGEELTIPSVAHELDRAGRLDEAGGEPYLVEVTGKHYTGVGVETHARIVADDARRRCLITLASQAAAAAHARHDLDTLRSIHDRVASEIVALSGGTRGVLPTHTPRQLNEATSATFADAALVDGLLYRGLTTLLLGRPKEGKTELMRSALAAMFAGRDFLGRPTTTGGVTLLTEEPGSVAGEALKFVGLGEADNVHIVLREEVLDPWQVVIEQAIDAAIARGDVLLVVDTITEWAGTEDENDAAHVLATLRPLRRATGANLGVLLLHHARKAGGDLVDAVRGSSALGGAVDVVAYLRRVDRDPPSSRRRELLARGRFGTNVQDRMIVEYDGTHYGLAESSGAESGDALLAALRAAQDGITAEEAALILDPDRAGSSDDKVRRASRQAFRRKLGLLVNDGLAKEIGSPKRWIAVRKEGHEDGHATLYGEDGHEGHGRAREGTAQIQNEGHAGAREGHAEGKGTGTRALEARALVPSRVPT